MTKATIATATKFTKIIKIIFILCIDPALVIILNSALRPKIAISHKIKLL